MNNLAIQYGYLGIFLISLIGAMSFIIPIPYSIVIFFAGGYQIAGQWVFNPFLIAVVAATGAATGEFSGYLIGFSGRRIINERYKKKMDFLMRLFEKFGSIVIFLFALTPLPDDLLFVPLGVMRFSPLKAFIPALIGKFFSNLIIAYGGRLSLQIIKEIFGLQGDGISILITIVLATVFLSIIILLMFKLDWEKYFEKYLDSTEKESKTQNQV